jgi:hypothetical protein
VSLSAHAGPDIRWWDIVLQTKRTAPLDVTLCMTFTKRLREGIRRGEITCSVQSGCVPASEPIGFPAITPELGAGLDLRKIANHGRGENIYLIRFHYVLHAPSEWVRVSISLVRTSNGFCVVLSWSKSSAGTNMSGHATCHPSDNHHLPKCRYLIPLASRHLSEQLASWQGKATGGRPSSFI